MKVIRTEIDDVLIIEPAIFTDNRGFFFESFNGRKFSDLIGRNVTFVQDNHSRSDRNVLRGMHYQIQHPQAKLMRVVQGSVFDVAVDIRKNSLTFGHYVGVEISADNKRMLWVPEGFAHGFVVVSDVAEVLYKTTDYWFPEHERCIRWDDPQLAISWPITESPVCSTKDSHGLMFNDADFFT